MNWSRLAAVGVSVSLHGLVLAAALRSRPPEYTHGAEHAPDEAIGSPLEEPSTEPLDSAAVPPLDLPPAPPPEDPPPPILPLPPTQRILVSAAPAAPAIITSGFSATAPQKYIARVGAAPRRTRAGGFSGGSSGGKLAMSYSPPRYLRTPPPMFPPELRGRTAATVLLAVRVDPTGRASEISVKRSSGNASLDAIASRTVRMWRFVPASRDGHDVSATVEIPVRFEL